MFVFAVLFAGFFVLLHPSGRAVFFPPLSAQRTHRGLARVLLMFVATALIGNLIVLLTLAAEDVRGDGDEVGFYLAVSVFWLVLTLLAFEFMGISLRDDVAARRNSAATATLCGLIVGQGFCLAGCNSGNGPGFEAVFFCIALSTAALFLAWMLFDAFSGIVERIAVERDFSAGIRGGVFLTGAGAILGGSVAGNWVSYFRTIVDLGRFGWPIAVLFMVSVGAEFALKKRGIALSAGYGAMAVAMCVLYAVRIWGLS